MANDPETQGSTLIGTPFTMRCLPVGSAEVGLSWNGERWGNKELGKGVKLGNSLTALEVSKELTSKELLNPLSNDVAAAVVDVSDGLLDSLQPPKAA